MKLAELSYRRNPAELFQHIADEPWSMFLDSGYPYIDRGRYDIILGRPYCTFVTRGAETVIEERNGTTRSAEDPFFLVKQGLGSISQNYTGIPFCGGAAGYLAYDLGRRIERLPAAAEDDLGLPEMAVGLYDWAVVIDHDQRRAWLASHARDPETARQWEELQRLFSAESRHRLATFQARSPIRANMDRDQYGRAFSRIKRYIRAGDCYQVNLAQRFSVDVSGRPWDIYQHLRRQNPAPFAGFLSTPEACVLSSSPERFLEVRNDLVETRPIKGTIRRSAYAYEDKALAQQLLESHKDRAENLMIVDLLRNDIGKNCELGTVAVPKLFALETFATVHHLVSTVTGRLAKGRHALDLLRGCFPGGSITGAPKLRAMEIIEELEPHRRSVYCGTLGYFGYDGAMDTNIAIRTLIQHHDTIHCWAGGGIVADSDEEGEYQECFAKAAAILKLFEQAAIRDVGS